MSESGLTSKDPSFSGPIGDTRSAEAPTRKVRVQNAKTAISNLTRRILKISNLTRRILKKSNNEKSFSNEKFREELVRSLKTKRSVIVEGKDNPGQTRYPRTFVRSLSIVAVLVSTLLMSSLYASIGPAAWGSELTTVMGDMFKLANGKNSSQSQVLKDNAPPKISDVKDVVAEATGRLTIVPLAEPSVKDNLDPAPTLTNDAPSDGYPVGTNGITWTAKDSAGNSATALQKVTLVDTTLPSIIAPSDIDVYVESSTYLTQVSLGIPIVQDAVDSSPDITNDAPPDGFPVGMTMVTWKALDASGNSATDTQLVSVMVEGTTSSTDSAQDTSSSSTTTSSSSETSSPTSTSTSTTSDSTSSVSTTSYGGSGGGGGGGGGSGGGKSSAKSNEDPSPDSGSVDSAPPTIIPPPFIVTDATGPLTLVALGWPTVSDSVDPSPTVTNDAPAGGFPLGTSIVTWRAIDDAGNYATAEQRILIEDWTPPSIVAPLDIVTEATGLKLIPLGVPIVSDLADASPLVSNDAPVNGFGMGSITVTWTATDAAGNSATAMQIVTIVDTTPPTIVAPDDDVVYVEDLGEVVVIPLGDPYVEDFGDNAAVVTNDAPAGGFPVGNTTVTWTASDRFGNSATDTQIITVLVLDTEEPSTDVNPPTIVAPPDVIAEATGLLTLVELGTPTATDIEDPGPTITNDAPADGFPVGKTTVTWTATDTAGNHATATQNVMVIATGSPIITVPASITAEASDLSGAAVDYSAYVSSYDLVDGPLVPVCEPAQGSTFALGVTAVTCYATDSDGNTASSTFNILVQDTMPPSMVAPADIIINATGTLTRVALGSASVSDTVDDAPVVTNNAPADGFPVGKTTVTWTAIDRFGNSATDTQLVAVVPEQDPTVIDNDADPDVNPPTIVAPPDVIAEATGLLTLVELGTPTATDIEDPNPTITNNAPALGFPLGNTTVTWSATDAAGNSKTDTQLVTVRSPNIDSCSELTQPPCFEFTPSALTYTFCSSGCKYNDLQAALNALPADGGTIKIKNVNNVPGNYNVRSNTIIQFEPNSRLVITASNPVFNIDNKQNVKILDADISTSHSGVRMVECKASSWITVDGGKAVLVKGGQSTVMYADSCSNVIFKDFDGRKATRIVDIGTLSGDRDGTCNNVWTYNITAQDTSEIGIKMNHCKNVYIWNNYVQDTIDNGIDIGFNSNSDVRGNTVVRGGVTQGTGIHTDQTNSALIYNNTFDQAGGNAVMVCGANNVTVRQNTITNSVATAIVVIKCAANTVSSTNTTIDGNIITNPGGAGIFVSGSQAYTDIKNNKISNYATSCIAVNSPNPTVTKVDNVCIP